MLWSIEKASRYKRHSGRKDRFFIAKDAAVNLQRKCGQNANKSIRGAFAKGGVESQRWGANAKNLPPKRKENEVGSNRKGTPGEWGQNAKKRRQRIV